MAHATETAWAALLDPITGHLEQWPKEDAEFAKQAKRVEQR